MRPTCKLSASLGVSLIVLGVGMVVALPSPGTAADSVPDRHGDPLPPGAVQRLGTARLRHGNVIPAIAFAPDGKTVASGSHDQTIALWEAGTGKLI